MAVKNGMRDNKCARCGTEYKRYTSKKIEDMHRIDGEALGLKWRKGVLACPKCKILNEGEYWL